MISGMKNRSLFSGRSHCWSTKNSTNAETPAASNPAITQAVQEAREKIEAAYDRDLQIAEAEADRLYQNE